MLAVPAGDGDGSHDPDEGLPGVLPEEDRDDSLGHSDDQGEDTDGHGGDADGQGQDESALDSLVALERLAERELEVGAIGYEAPRRMDLGQVTQVVARISREEDRDLTEGLEDAVQESLPVGTTVAPS